MTTNDREDDVFDTGDLDGDPGFEDFEGGKTSLSEMIRDNPAAKLGVILGAVAVIVGGIALFGGGPKEAPAPSTVARGSDLSEPPGMSELSQHYEEALRESNEQDLQRALQQGGSAIPVPIGPARGRVDLQGQTQAEDPLERWRRIQEERLRKEREAAESAQAGVPQPPPPRPVDPYAEDKQNVAESLMAQMQSILEAQQIKGLRILQVTGSGYMESLRSKEAEKLASAQGAVGAAVTAGASTATEAEVLQEAGQIEYAQLLIEANTDSPGPVLAELASGRMAGSRMIGSFASTEDYLTLNFHTVVVDGVALSTNAIAIDPGTSRPGMVTEIDRKYFQRIILPAAAAFIQGMGGAIAESGSTTVSAGQGTTVSSSNDLNTKQEFFKGIEKVADKVGEVLERQQTRPMLRLAAGTHLGVLFLSTVERDSVTGRSVAQERPVDSQPVFPQPQQLLLQFQQPAAPVGAQLMQPVGATQ